VRFVLAIVAFVVAAAMIGVGIAQRTILAPPNDVSAAATIAGGEPFTVIDGKVLNAHPGQQTLYVSGASKQFVAYGRTADVIAWLGDSPYASVRYNATTNALTSRVVTPKSTAGSGSTPAPAPTTGATGAPGATGAAAASNPAGSDLWLEEFSGANAATTRMNVPSNISVIIASDGTHAAPNSVRLVWPLNGSTPWSGPLIVGGGILLLIGLALYLWGLYNLRKSRGPRRSGPKMPKLPKSPRYRPVRAIESSSKGRRSIRRSVVVAGPTVIISALVLSGCSADYWPSFSSSSSPTATSTAGSTAVPNAPAGVIPPDVTVPQLQNIIAKIAALTTNADTTMNSNALATRFAGPALALRQANYAIRAKNPSEPALPPIPAASFLATLPQATDTWPRVVETVIQNKNDAKQAPIALVLVQQTPRDNYMINYAVSLEPDAKVPDLAPASIGSSVVPPDSKLLLLPPQDIAAAYGDILLNGAKSKDFSLFEAKGDTLRTAVGADYKASKIASVPATASLAFSNAVGKGKPIAMATNDSGAIVSVELDETETLKVAQAGAEVGAGAAAAALSGLTTSKKGIVSTYAYQLLFYVPPAQSTAKITLLGFAQGLVSATEVP
jgi:hypothetical protein